MKNKIKKVASILVVTSFVGLVGWHITLGTPKVASDITLENIEALAVEISSPGNWTVDVHGSHSWTCYSGGVVCCPNFYSESC